MPDTVPAAETVSPTATDTSVYGNPMPQTTVELERESLNGRIKVAHGIAARATREGDSRTATRWSATVDELLDHLLDVDARVRVACAHLADIDGLGGPCSTERG